MKKVIGPFSEIITLAGIPLKGPVKDEDLLIHRDAGVLVDEGRCVAVGDFSQLAGNVDVEEVTTPMVLMPGMVDCHTHLCWGGTRAADYALRTSGASYQEILARKGGIHETVRKTRASHEDDLFQQSKARLTRHLSEGVTTAEVKSGYGLNMPDEIKMLEVARKLHERTPMDIVTTCLAAHVRPGEYEHNGNYLDFILNDLLPQIKGKGLSHRVDIFVEDNAFTVEDGDYFLNKARSKGFALTVHADQFTTGGSALAVKYGAVSADHLENSGDREIDLLANSDTAGVVLPGASLGLGMQFAPSRKLLDKGVCLAIASDWNPGSAPMGDLLTEAALLGAYEKLSAAELFSGLTFRAARALGLDDRGRIESGQLADLIAFPTSDYREILWQQGKMKPSLVWKGGQLVSDA